MIGRWLPISAESCRSAWRVIAPIPMRSLGHGNAGHPGHSVEIDEMIRRDDAHVEHRHQRLAAGEQLRVLKTREQIVELGAASRIVIGERCRLHGTLAHMPRCAATLDRARRGRKTTLIAVARSLC